MPAAPRPACTRARSIGAGARIAASASIGPHCVVDADAEIGEGASLGPHCIVGRGCSVGAQSRLVARVTLVQDVTLGKRVLCIRAP